MVHAGCVSNSGIHPYRLRHEYQDLLSPWDGLHVCTDQTSVYTLIRKNFREWSQNPCKLQEKNPLFRKNSPQRRIEPMTLHQAGQRAQHTTNKLSRPPFCLTRPTRLHFHTLFSQYHYPKSKGDDLLGDCAVAS